MDAALSERNASRRRLVTGAVLGFDPGGSSRKGNGAAILRVEHGNVAQFETASLESVKDAVRWFESTADPSSWVGMGIDTLLAWSQEREGLRVADRWLRATYKPVSRSVVCPNGLYGAMAIGGPLLGMQLRILQPELPLFETHPKVVYYALRNEPCRWPDSDGAMQSWLQSTLACSTSLSVGTSDEFDALLSAYCALESLSDDWAFDLYSLSQDDHEPLLFPVPGPPAAYPWPERISLEGPQ